ncbi:MAG TPA: hypothetical protein VFV55_00975, partial [Usitatibacteraceae bacterium]|nr:hypothetical protein [Usitatibacteraceae bacterium]
HISFRAATSQIASGPQVLVKARISKWPGSCDDGPGQGLAQSGEPDEKLNRHHPRLARQRRWHDGKTVKAAKDPFLTRLATYCNAAGIPAIAKAADDDDQDLPRDSRTALPQTGLTGRIVHERGTRLRGRRRFDEQ